MATASPTRQDLDRRGQRLEYFTVAYNSAEGSVSIVAGLIAGSVSLVGFGLNSTIEVASGVALLWRLHHDLDQEFRKALAGSEAARDECVKAGRAFLQAQGPASQLKIRIR